MLAEPSSADLYTVEELLTAMGIIAQGLVKNVKFIIVYFWDDALKGPAITHERAFDGLVVLLIKATVNLLVSPLATVVVRLAIVAPAACTVALRSASHIRMTQLFGSGPTNPKGQYEYQ